MPQALKKPPDLDDDFNPLDTSVKSQKPSDIDDEPTIDDLLNDAKLSLNQNETAAPKPVEAKRKGFIESFSDEFAPLTEPLTDWFSRQSDKSADIIDSPRLNRTPFEAQIEGFKAGATQGLGKILDSMTSPINLATMAATAGQGMAVKAGLSKVAQLLDYGVKGLSGAMTGAGVKHTVEGETIPDKLFGIAETAGGLAGMKTSGAKPKANVPEALPVKPPYESPIVKRPYEVLSNEQLAQPEVMPKPAVRANLDGTFTDKSTGQPFDPSTLKGLEPAVKPELEFLDPKTGETRPASQAQPGDIPLLPEAQPNVAPEQAIRRAGKRMGTPDLGPTPEALASKPPDIPDDPGFAAAGGEAGRQARLAGLGKALDTPVTPEAPADFNSWLDRLKSDRGALNVTEIGDALAGREPTTPVNPDQAIIDRKLQEQRTSPPDESAAPIRQEPDIDPVRTIDPNTVPLWNRRHIDQLVAAGDRVGLESYVRGYERGNPAATEVINYGRAYLDSMDPPGTTIPASRSDWDIPSQATQDSLNRPLGRSSEWDQAVEHGIELPEQRFDSGAPHPTTTEAIHDLSTDHLREFIGARTDRNLTSYARGVLQERTRSFDEHGNYRDRTEPTTSHTGGEYDFADTPEPAHNIWKSYEAEPEGKAGKTLDEIEATRKTPALERLGKIIGEDRATQLTSGEKNIEFDMTTRRHKGKKIHPSTAESWARWGDETLTELSPDPGKPGISIEPHSISGMFPNALEIAYRDASGNPIGILKTDLQGKGISILAVSSKLGLRRGKVAFEMLKQAFDRGITEPSGTTSEFTNNLIERVKRLARSEKGELNLEEIYSAINDLIGKVSDSKIGKTVGGKLKQLWNDETGSANVKDPLDALKELFEKSKKGALTPEEMAQAKKLAKEQSVSPKTEASPKEYLEGKSQVDTGPTIPENAGVKSGADVVTESLSKRLKKAVDEAGQPNAAAPEEISKLIDEGTKVLNNMPDGPEKPGVIRQILGANKALLTSWDVSAPGRQGKSLILNKAWWTSLGDMVEAWKSPVAAKLINDSITEHPSGYFKRPVSKDGTVGKSFAEKAGLELASTEEMFNAKLGVVFEKYSGIGKSSRAHTAFLNKLRSDQFVSMIEASKRAGQDPLHHTHLAEKYATFINDATGRGSVNIGSWKLERNLNTLNDVFFAPKNMAGQIRTWNTVLNPYKYATADPVMRKQALRSLFAIAGLGLGVGQIASLAGAQVSNDPTNSDFRKIKLGDTRIDLFGGYQQFPVAAMRFIIGQSTSSISEETTDLTEGKFGRQTRATLAERFFTNRLSPLGSFIWAWMSTKEFDGKPFEVKKALYERTFPIAAKDITDLAQEDPFLAGILTPTTLMGLTGTQHYSGR